MKPSDRPPSIPSGFTLCSHTGSQYFVCGSIAFAVAISAVCCAPPSRTPSQTIVESTVESHSFVKTIDETLTPLITVNISPEARVKATAGDRAMELHQGEWQDFTIEIDNAAGITAPLAVESEQIMIDSGERSRDRWLQIAIAPNGPLTGDLKEFRKLRLKSRDAGIRTAILNFNAGQGTQDLGFRSDVVVTFRIHK